MENNVSAENNKDRKSFFLNEILGSKVLLNDKKIGKLSDLVIVENGKIPQVTNFYITRSFGNPALLVPLENVKSVDNDSKEIIIDIENLKKYERKPEEKEVLLKDHILDKKVLDLEGREVEVVYDIKLTMMNNKLYVSDVDLSRYGLLRRMGLKWLANFIYSLADKIKNQTISWKYIQPLPTQITSFKGDVKLNVLKEKLAEMPPVDIADIIEELDPVHRTIIFDELDVDRASDTLEEIDPSVQRTLISSIKKEKVAEIISKMTPGQAADVLSVLPWWESKVILKLLSPPSAKKIRSIMEMQEQKILHFATSKFLKIDADKTVEDARQEYQQVAKNKKVIMYFYIVEGNEKLVGVIDIRQMLQAKDKTKLRDIMVDNIVTLKPESTLKEASGMFKRYGFRAIPVTDENDKLLGVVPYRDVMSLTHHLLD